MGALVALIVVAYAQVGGHACLSLDDDVYVTRNPWIRDGLSWTSVLLTWRQVSYWEDSITLFAHAVAVTNNLGEALAAAGRTEEAATHYAKAARIHPGYAPARNNVGLILAHQGRYAGAEQEFRAALACSPRSAVTESNLATIRARLGPDRSRRRDSRGQGNSPLAAGHFAFLMVPVERRNDAKVSESQ